MVRWWRLYLADIEDTREEDEDWRAAIHVPYPYSGVETRVSSLVDILNASDPPIQAGPVSGEDRRVAMGAESLLGVTLDMNYWRLTLDKLLRERCVQGTALARLAWRTEMTMVNVAPTAEEVFAYNSLLSQSISAALKAGLGPPPAPDELGQFMEWLQFIEQQGVPVPQSPFQEQVATRTFSGPKLERLSIFDCTYDPSVEFLQEQPLFVIRSLRREEWLDKFAGPEPDKPFDPRAVEEGKRAKGTAEPSKFARQDKEIQEVLSINRQAGAIGVDPYYRYAHEIWECFMPGSETPYLVILNPRAASGAIINKRQDRMPYAHGQIPILHMKNTPVGGYFNGISELQQPERLFYEMNAHRNLLMDAITLQTMPVFAKTNAFGLPVSQFSIRPGAVWDLPRADAINTVTKAVPLGDAWNLFHSLKADIDETNSTPPQLRGGPATVGRVSATESERRYSQALARIKQDAMRTEDELTPFCKQSLMLWYQFTSFEERQRMGVPNNLANDEIIQSLEFDIRFRGATRSLNRDMLVQQMMTFVTNFGAVLPPAKLLTIGRRIWEAMGLKSVDEIISREDIETMERQQNAPPPAEGQGAPGNGGPPPEGLVEGGGPLIDQGPATAPTPEDVQMAVGFPGVPGAGATVEGG